MGSHDDDDDEDDRKHIYSMYTKLGTFLSTLYVLTHLILKKIIILIL